jgi:bla regulator protein BlaR1
MIFKYLSEMTSKLGPAVANHLWQSTVFVVVAALLTHALQRNHAHARYWVWLAASLKFLVPFSLLIDLGRHLPWSRVSSGLQVGLYSAMEQISQPFSNRATYLASQTIPTTGASPSGLAHLFPLSLAAIWFCGFTVVLLVWYVRWHQLSMLAWKAKRLLDGREVEALRRIERVERIQKPIELRLSPASLEPGIFGMARPLLIWPQGISQRLNDSQLEAVIAHEVWHVHRRDNLTASIHMFVEAFFWFHPLVWWLGARLEEERERSCDEEVLELGNERGVYAEGILKVCEFCVSSPLGSVSGVTGADLKRRVVRIMAEDVGHKLDVSKKLLLTAAGLIAVGLPVAFGVTSLTRVGAQSPATNASIAAQFEVASIKPDKDATGVFSFGWFTPGTFTTRGATVQYLIQEAYQVTDDQIFGAPSRLKSERYDIKAKVPSSVVDEILKLDFEQSNLVCFRMLQNLLTDRFKLTFHKETRELPRFVLVVAKNGPKLHEAKPGDTYPDGIKDMNGKGHGNVMQFGRGLLTGQGVPISDLVKMLSQQHLGLIIVDKTGLTAKYDFTLKWNPENLSTGLTEGNQPSSGDTPADTSGPSLFAAIQEQLGLKLEREKGPVEVLVIDHVERPSEN